MTRGVNLLTFVKLVSQMKTRLLNFMVTSETVQMIGETVLGMIARTLRIPTMDGGTTSARIAGGR